MEVEAPSPGLTLTKGGGACISTLTTQASTTPKMSQEPGEESRLDEGPFSDVKKPPSS